MVSFEKNVLIDSSPETVFAYVSDPSKMPEWISSVVEVRDIIGTGEGQQYDWTFQAVGLLLRGQSTVVESVLNELAVHQSIGSVSSVTTLLVEPRERGTSLTFKAEYRIPIPVLGRLAEHLIEKRDSRLFDLALANVKEMMER